MFIPFFILSLISVAVAAPLATEEPVDVLKFCHGKPADIFFLLDSSSSIWIVHYRKQLKFIQDLVATFPISQTDTRIGVGIFSHLYQTQISFGDFDNVDDLQNRIKRIPHMLGSTYTGRALGKVRNEFVRKARPGVAHVAVILTDGVSRNVISTFNQARLLKDQGVYVFAIGIGKGPNMKELQAIGSEPSDEFVFKVASFNILESIKDKLAMKVCRVPKYQAYCSAEVETDVMFAYDFASMGTKNVRHAHNFISDVVGKFGNMAEGMVRAGMLSGFCENSRIDLNQYNNKRRCPALSVTPRLEVWTTSLKNSIATVTTYPGEDGETQEKWPFFLWMTLIGAREGHIVGGKRRSTRENICLTFSTLLLDILYHCHHTQRIAKMFIPFFILSLISVAVAAPMATEEPVDVLKFCHGKPADIFFLLDSSSSIWIVHYRKQLKFIQDLVATFPISQTDTRIGVGIFSHLYQTQISFGDFDNVDDLQNRIKRIPHMLGSTYTGRALGKVRNEFVRKARPGVAHVAVILTDGVSRNVISTFNQARLLKDQGVYVFAIGIGKGPNMKELQAIGSKPSDEFVFKVASFNILESIKDKLAMKVCRVPKYQAYCSAEVETDVMFAYDFASMGTKNVRHAHNFISDVVGKFGNMAEGMVRAGMLSGFCENSRIDLNQYNNKAEMSSAVRNTEVRGLDNIVEELHRNSYNISRGGRETQEKWPFFLWMTL
ncbi:collagen alpha-4(VI) chain-like [Pecten maximus]|uniref:collagen alpha-4(VI) chain-like n=1 Tax=Pecten maximus TaxID=6579 RepID=UPI001458ED89|nr:collagen alpha-4(VI) chain-like [Pecten maximus]